MSEQKRRGCGCAALTARAQLENMPMTRYANPIPICSCPQECGTGCAAQSAQLEEILETLACQNQLLADLLGAVNSLTATLLAQRSCGCP